VRNRIANPIPARVQGKADASLLLAATLALSLLLLTAIPFSGLDQPTARGLALLSGTAGLVLVLVLLWRIHREGAALLGQVRTWARRLLNGDTEARLDPTASPWHQDLVTALNGLGERLQTLSQDMDTQVHRQTEHIKEKTRSLEVLYDVAASINSSRDLDDLLTRFLHTLKEVVHARAATVRLLGKDNQMRLVASLGLSKEVIHKEQLLPSSECLCGQVVEEGTVLTYSDLSHCDRLAGTRFFDGEDIGMIAVPLQYRGRTLGVYNLFVDAGYQADPDNQELLVSIGRHLGMAIEKASVDEEANRLSIIEERTRIAHELHDSLAQTLASLRFQVRVLDETLHRGDESALWAELERIENSLDEAYAELRGLIDHFRAPIDSRGLVPAIEKLVQRFRNESRIPLFLQMEWDSADLPEEMEIQVLRIIQEALANVRKHSQAHTVRLLMRSTPDGRYNVLIEDDGVGIPEHPRSGPPGEHVGLSIMEERARRIGGNLRIESEPGEGTRIQLSFNAPKQSPAPAQEINIPLSRLSS